MQSLLFLFAFFVAFAGRVLAFDIPVGDTTFKTSEILAIPDGPVKSACAANCTIASSSINACADDTTCLCQVSTFAAVLACETCMFQYLIAINKPMPDPRAGSNVVLSGYVAGCATANPGLAKGQTALALPATWDGPLVSVLPLGGTIATVMIGAILGVSGMLLLCNM